MCKRRYFISGREITSDGTSYSLCMQNINMYITINARRPFAAEELAVGWIDLVFKGICQIFQFLCIVRNTILDPEIHMRCRVSQGCIHLKILIGIYIGRPELLFITYRVWR